MAHEVRMPQLSQSVVEGEITRWRVQVGDRVELDQVLAEIGTDKVDVEMPSPVAGTVLAILVPEGRTVAIGTPLLVVGEEGESATEGVTATGAVYSSLTASLVGAGGAAGPAAAGAPRGQRPDPAGGGSPGRREESGPAEAVGDVGASPAGSAAGRPGAEPPAGAGDASPGPVRATPAVRRLARDLGVDLAGLAGSGPGGRITAEDVQRAAERPR